MADNKDKKQNSSIFSKILSAGEAILEAQIAKAEASIKNIATEEESRKKEDMNYSFGKAVTKDKHYAIGSQGFTEKVTGLSFDQLKLMAIRSSIISAIIKTRQNRVSAFAKIAKTQDELGFKIKLKDEQAYLEKLREELLSGSKQSAKSEEDRSSSLFSEIKKADDDVEPISVQDAKWLEQAESPADEFAMLSDKEQDRMLKEILEEKTKKKKQAIAEFVLNCGETKDRPFDSRKWNLESFLRSTVWDSLIYDQVAVERVPKEAQVVNGRLNIHHFYPVDGSTIRYATAALKDIKELNPLSGYDILYPEEEIKALERRDAVTLDEQKLADDEYKWVQVIRGRIERAFTDEELAVGFRNPTADILANGYPISELELLISLVTSHLNTEYYNIAYFKQGFSAKGILHVKANLNPARLEDIRMRWNAMVSGNRNSFQTPILSGADDIQWIPLTQNHNEMEFSLWLNYLVKMICAIYLIDPSEIGYSMPNEKTGQLSGDNTKEKLENSKDKGFVPLMRFFERFLNQNIVDHLDPDYMLEWVGLKSESSEAKLAKQEKEGRLFKSVNELRIENGLTPIEGADDLILDNVYFQWFSQFHQEGMRKQEADAQDQQMGQMDSQQYEMANKQSDQEHERQLAEQEQQNQLEQKKLESVAKSLKIEYYTLED